MEEKLFSKHPNRRLMAFYRGLPAPVNAWKHCGVSLVYTGAKHFIGGLTFEPTAGEPDLRWMNWWVNPLFTPERFLSLGFGERIPVDNRFAVRGQLVAVKDGARFAVERTYDAIREEGVPNIIGNSQFAPFYEFVLSGRSGNLNPCWDHFAMAGCSVHLELPVATTLNHLDQSRRGLMHIDDVAESLAYLEQLEMHVLIGRQEALSYLSAVETMMRDRYGVYE